MPTTEQRAVALRFSIDTKESAVKKYSPDPYVCLLAEHPEKSGYSPGTAAKRKSSARECSPETTDIKPEKNAESKKAKGEGTGGPSGRSSNEPTVGPGMNRPAGKSETAAAPDPQNRPRYTEPFKNRFYLEVTGEVDYEQTLIDDDFTIFSVCTGSDPLATGFASNLKTGFADRDWFQVGTNEIVGPGETGVYTTRFMMWLNGVEPPPGMPPDSQIKVSRRFEGSGTVHLTRHLATRDKRRMQGTVKGEVKQKNGNLKVRIFAEFDLAQSCGTEDDGHQ